MIAGPTTNGFRPRRRARRTSAQPTPVDRRNNLLLVSWAVTCACAYLGFGSPQPLGVELVLVAVVGAMVAANVLIGRVDPRRLGSPVFAVGAAVFYTGLLLAAWQLGGQGSVEILVAAIALFDLALVGLTTAELAAAALAMFLVYAVMV